MKGIIFFIVISFIFFSSNESNAQSSRSGKIGIGYSGNFTSQSNELAASIWIGDKLTVEPQIGLKRVSLENSSVTNWKPGLGFLFRIKSSEISPFIAFRTKLNITSGESVNYIDFTGSLGFGGEYFFSDWFSAGAELKLNYIITDKKYSPSYMADATIIETEQVMNFRIYLR